MRSLRLAGSIAAVACGIYFLQWDRIIASLERINAWSFISAVVLAAASTALLGLRWIFITRRLVSAPLIEQWRVYLYATFLNSFTPANIGGDAYRVVVLRSRTKHAPSSLLGAIAVERAMGLWAFLAGYVVAISAATMGGLHSLNRSFIYAMGPIAAALLTLPLVPSAMHRIHWRKGLARFPTLVRQLGLFGRAMVLATGRTVGSLVIVSLISWAFWVAATAVVASQLGLHIALPLLAAIVTLTELVRLIPISFQGIGVREVTFSALAALAGASSVTGFAVATVTYAALSATLGLAGIAAWIIGLGRPHDQAATPASETVTARQQ